MLNLNVKEYELLQNELASIRTCITNYISYLIGSSGVGFFTLSFIEIKNTSDSTHLITSLGACLIITSLYYVLTYKFISHNRYSGYVKLINQEVNVVPINNNISILKIDNMIAWELCMGKLQNMISTGQFPERYWKNLHFSLMKNEKELSFNKDEEEIKALLHKKWESFRVDSPQIDKNSFWRGLKLIFRGVTKNDGSGSWKYPLYLTYIIIVFNMLFFFISTFFFVSYINENHYHLSFYYLNILSYIFTLLVLTYIWVRNTIELYKVMLGSKTINAFCWKFLQYRVEVLNQYNLAPKYQITDRFERDIEFTPDSSN